MVRARYAFLFLALILSFAIAAQGALAQTTFTLKVSTDSTAYVSGQTIKISGSVAPAPGASTGVTLKVINPSGTDVAVGEADVGAASGLYNYTFVAGGSSGWTTGTYTVNATWGAFPPQIFAKTTFTYSPTATSTTTSTTTQSTSSTTTQTTTTSTTTSSSSSTTTTTTSSSSGGGIPEFPFQGFLAAVVALGVAAAYLASRKYVRSPSLPVR